MCGCDLLCKGCITRGRRTSLLNNLNRTGNHAYERKRDTCKYELRDGNKVVYIGITNDMTRREQEHRAEGMKFTSMTQVGRRTTREAASEWESDRIATYMGNHKGQRPEYNKNDSGK